MARMPGQPTGDDGRPVVPSATASEDDVEGHIAVSPQDEDDEPPRGPTPTI